MLILRMFALNMIQRMPNILRKTPDSKRRAKAAAVRQFAAFAGLAGFRGLPFMGLIYALINVVLALMESDKTVEMIEREIFGEIEQELGLPERALTTGVGAYLDIESSRLIGASDYVPSRFDPTSLVGFAGSLANRARYSMQHAMQGQYIKALEQAPVSPRVLSSYLRGSRIEKEGVITRGGYPSLSPWQVSKGDVLRLKLAFTPTSVASAYEESRAKGMVGRVKATKFDALMSRYAPALVANDTTAIRDVMQDLASYNQKMYAAGKIAEVIDDKQFFLEAQRRISGVGGARKALPERIERGERYNIEAKKRRRIKE